MKTKVLWLAMLCGCTASPSSFDFQLGADRVVSGETVSGSVDNAGTLALHDDAWALDMSLPGLTAGEWLPLGAGSGDLTIVSKASGAIFTTASGGTCQVMLDPHKSTNGSVVSGVFHCVALASIDGTARVDVPEGGFATRIDDAANNPSSSPWP